MNRAKRSGRSIIFSEGGRDQFWYEGAVVAFLNVAMALAIYGVYSAAGWKRWEWSMNTINDPWRHCSGAAWHA